MIFNEKKISLQYRKLNKKNKKWIENASTLNKNMSNTKRTQNNMDGNKTKQNNKTH